MLVLDYLNTTKTAAPETQMRAESYVGTGYQRLLTFEATGGGFSLFGGGPADPFLSGYGLLQLTDMAKVYPVDKAVIDRTARWLLSQQNEDGSWNADDYRAGRGSLGMTAFVTWALSDTGYGADPAVERAIKYLDLNAGTERDPYTLALVANALVAARPKGETTAPTLERLASLATRDEKGAHWTGEQTMMGGYGSTGAVESTALAVHALIRGGRQLPLAEDALSFIVQSKDSWGTWGSTQATIWSLKALVLSATTGDASEANATVRVALNGGTPQEFALTPADADVVRAVTFDGAVLPGENTVTLDVAGQGSLMYQVTAIYYLPWSVAPPEPEGPGLMDVQVAYDRTTLSVDDVATVRVSARLTRAGQARMVVLDLGIPPGFTVQAEDLSALVEGKAISRYELTGRQIIVYVENMTSEQPLEFSYRLKARFPMRVKSQPGSAYDYYNPEQPSLVVPTLMTVAGA